MSGMRLDWVAQNANEKLHAHQDHGQHKDCQQPPLWHHQRAANHRAELMRIHRARGCNEHEARADDKADQTQDPLQ